MVDIQLTKQPLLTFKHSHIVKKGKVKGSYQQAQQQLPKNLWFIPGVPPVGHRHGGKTAGYRRMLQSRGVFWAVPTNAPEHPQPPPPQPKTVPTRHRGRPTGGKRIFSQAKALRSTKFQAQRRRHFRHALWAAGAGQHLNYSPTNC